MVTRRKLTATCAAAVACGFFVADASAIGPITGGPRPDNSPIVAVGLADRQQHMFGDNLRLKIQIVVDTARVDPSRVDVRPHFGPYRQLRAVDVSRVTSGKRTVLLYDYLLGCITARCLPRGDGYVELPPAEIRYTVRRQSQVREHTVPWPLIHVAGRIDPEQLGLGEPREEIRDVPPVTYRVSPRALSLTASALAVVFAAAAAFLILRRLPLARLAARLGLRRQRARTPLERALVLVRESAQSGRSEDGRRALERLAVELRRARNPTLAYAASRLAWSADDPVGVGVANLSDEVQRVISSNGH